MNIGSDKIKSIYIGSDKAKNAYLGSDKVYSDEPEATKWHISCVDSSGNEFSSSDILVTDETVQYTFPLQKWYDMICTFKTDGSGTTVGLSQAGQGTILTRQSLDSSYSSATFYGEVRATWLGNYSLELKELFT